MLRRSHSKTVPPLRTPRPPIGPQPRFADPREKDDSLDHSPWRLLNLKRIIILIVSVGLHKQHKLFKLLHAGALLLAFAGAINAAAKPGTAANAPAQSDHSPSLEPRAGTRQYRYTNRLIHAKSPYLLLHAHNPVDWYPWGDEAFEKARKERSEEHTSELQSRLHLVCRLLLEKKKKQTLIGSTGADVPL